MRLEVLFCVYSRLLSRNNLVLSSVLSNEDINVSIANYFVTFNCSLQNGFARLFQQKCFETNRNISLFAMFKSSKVLLFVPSTIERNAQLLSYKTRLLIL